MSFIYNVLSRSGTMEILFREVATSSVKLKIFLKRKMKAAPKRQYSKDEILNNREKVWTTLGNCGIKNGDIVIIHSAVSGLESLHMSNEEIMDKILTIWGSEVTIVFPTFRMENQKAYTDGKRIRKYNPDRGICWTGMLPNVFLKQDGVVKSRFPFNSLSALGPQAKAMMEHDMESVRPHDKNSPWAYCATHHAKILMLGVKSLESNTMSEHMAPDIMGDKWPIRDWYEKLDYIITIGNHTFEKKIEVQQPWSSKYVTNYKFDRWLKKAGLVSNISTSNVTIEYVDDSKKMLDWIIHEASEGNLIYKVPKRYLK